MNNIDMRTILINASIEVDSISNYDEKVKKFNEIIINKGVKNKKYIFIENRNYWKESHETI